MGTPDARLLLQDPWLADLEDLSGEETPDANMAGHNPAAQLDVLAGNESTDPVSVPRPCRLPDSPAAEHFECDRDPRETMATNTSTARIFAGSLAEPFRDAPVWQAVSRRPSASHSSRECEVGEGGLYRQIKRASLPSSPMTVAVALEDLPEEVLLKVR